VYHLLTSEFDAAADWYEQMIEERDPFALLYVRTPILGPLREHRRWPDLAALMKLPAIAPLNDQPKWGPSDALREQQAFARVSNAVFGIPLRVEKRFANP
jgi:hypothetical protein